MKKPILGIDIGGTKIFHALVDVEGKILTDVKKELTPSNVNDIENLLKKIINFYENETNIAGIATAGAVNNENDKILSSTANLPYGYSDIDFKNLNNNVEIFIENDANAAAWAEHKTGVTKGYKNSIVLTLGTGVGSGIIINNNLLKGKSGAAGEMHFKMSTENKRLCTCGAYDCFETYVSGRGLKLTYKDIAGIDLSTYEIIARRDKNEKEAVSALKKWNEYIAMGALGLNNIFDTDIIAFTGSMAQFADMEFIEKYVNKYTLTTPLKTALAKAGNYSGLIGAALIARKKAEQV